MEVPSLFVIMIKETKPRFRELWSTRAIAGQALAEYAIIAFFCVVLLTGIFKGFELALTRYYESIVAVIALPIP